MQRQHTYNDLLGQVAAWMLFLGLFAFAGPQLWAQSGNVPKASFKVLEALTDQGNDGLKGIAIRFSLKMEGENVSPSASNYYLECQVRDEFGDAIPAATGAIAYRNAQGECRDSIAVNPYSPEHAAEGLAMFVPYFAIGLPTGPCRVKLQLRLREQHSHRLIAESERVDLSFQKPRMQLYRMTVERIETYTTDVDGETWDYKFLNARDIYPDIIWSLRRGHQDIFESPKQKNDTIYKGTAKDKSPWLWLSEGDRIHFSVKDFDLLGFSDLIGNLGIDIWRPDFTSGTRNQLHFERVREAQVIQEALTPPGIAIRSYEVLENEVYEGVTGLRLRMDYEVSSVGNGARAFLAIRLPQDGGSAVPQAIRIIGPGAIPASNGMVELTASRSHLELFLAHYAFPQGIPARGNLLLDAMTLIDGQFFRLSQHKKQLSGRSTSVQDFQFGQWKIGADDRVGRGGILVDLAYSVPQAYFAEEGKTKVQLEPSITATWGMVDKGAVEAIGPSAAAWDGQFLTIEAGNATGNLQLFIPFGECPPGPAKSLDFQVSYHAQYSLNDRLIDIGHKQQIATVELPRLRKLEIGLREASVVQRAWLLSPPSMFWELYCGNLLLHRSKIDPEKRNARWENNEMGDWVFAGSDRIELRIYHKGTNGDPDKLLEIWSGQLNGLPDREKGNFRLPTTSLKKLILHLDYQDNSRQGGATH